MGAAIRTDNILMHTASPFFFVAYLGPVSENANSPPASGGGGA